MRLLDRLSIYALSLAIVGLVIVLLWGKTGKTGDSSDNPKQRDLFNMKEYPQRQKDFEQLDRLERIK